MKLIIFHITTIWNKTANIALRNNVILLITRRYQSNRDLELLNTLLKMPKSKNVVAQPRVPKVKPKTTISTIPSTISLHVLGNGSEGSSRCLYVSTSNGRYIFNCGEGTQRLANEHKLKLSKLEAIFITYKSWKNFGGLPGLSLTVQEIGIPKIFLHGPPNLSKLYDTMKCVIDMKDLTVEYKSYENKVFVDNSMEVKYVPLSSEVTKDGTEPLKAEAESNNSQNGARKKHKSDLDKDNKDISIAYICKFHDKPGQLLLKKCVDYGVPPGPLLGQLKNGEDVTLPNGQIVRSRDVVAPIEPGPVLLVLECPSTDYLDSLLNEKAFEVHQSCGTEDNHASVVIHFTELDVLCDQRYQEWMNRFPASTMHLALNSSNASLSSIAIHRIQHMLHLIHPRIFPLLKTTNEMISGNYGSSLVVPSESMVSYSLRPKEGLSRETSVNLDVDSFNREAFEKPDFEGNLKELQHILLEEKPNETNNAIYPEIAFLGTGSCIPSKVRNVSGILVHINEEICMLLDCGEGTYIQLFRLYGSEGIRDIIRKIKCIFISHLHADHHLGLVQILKTRSKVNGDVPLFLVAPFYVIQWLNNYHCEFEPLLNNVVIIPNINLAYNNEKNVPNYKELLETTKLKEVSTIPVKHCKDAHAILFTTSCDYKVVYSGDTMPCDSLIVAGQNCSLLIHEATMEDDLEEEAKLKTHSTTSQAIDVSKRMNAQFTILTHFSQRYAKVPIFPKNDSGTIGFAFDNMVVRPCDLRLLPLFLPCLKSLFAEHYEEMQEKTAKRLRQKQILTEMMQQNAL
ncbi:ribonuclease Z, mitochondrial-like [Centruroides sculpturatus]|uniref:ribonuclease Z, mitochondrial-like n=1 Tax=Centruroides sculpturatus TaxID=218467 RepID=UPI000C6E0941|nr:ribonuclease Z, mitochondrial-like [Centruroides sculpturatus]